MPKTFVLDTSVLLFDHNAINNFEDNDIIIPITVLEELDNFKIGNATTNYEARNVIRYLDKLSEDQQLSSWISLGEKKGRIKVSLKIDSQNGLAQSIFGSDKNDHRIINVALAEQEQNKKTTVILVTKDINLRIKAKAIGLESEDYMTGKVENVENLGESYRSKLTDLDAEIIRDLYEKKEIDEDGILRNNKVANGYYVLNNCSNSALAKYNSKSKKIELVEKEKAYGIKPKNAEQTFALDALLDQNIRLVALQGVAGTGKTLLALAAALEQKNRYDQIILSRPIIPLSNREIGFLPGGAEEKISPYMQPLWDNLKVIKSQYRGKRAKDQVDRGYARKW